MFIDSVIIQWEKEEHVDMDVTQGMINVSITKDGGQLYPYVFIEGGKYYLEDLS